MLDWFGQKPFPSDKGKRLHKREKTSPFLFPRIEANSCFGFGGGSFVGSPMWKLQSPSCPLLTKLRELSTEVTNITKITLSLGEFSTVNSKQTGNCSATVVSTLKFRLFWYLFRVTFLKNPVVWICFSPVTCLIFFNFSVSYPFCILPLDSSHQFLTVSVNFWIVITRHCQFKLWKAFCVKFLSNSVCVCIAAFRPPSSFSWCIQEGFARWDRGF